MLYSCKEKKETDLKQLALVKKDCQNKNACQIEVSREFFGNSECPGTEDADMNLWLIYSCNDGGTDKTTSHKPSCNTGTGTGTGTSDEEQGTGTGTGTGTCTGDEEQGKKNQLDVRGCGGWVNLECKGGCLNIHKVINHLSIGTWRANSCLSTELIFGATFQKTSQTDPTSDPTLDPTSNSTFDPTSDLTSDLISDTTSDPNSDPTFDTSSDPIPEQQSQKILLRKQLF